MKLVIVESPTKAKTISRFLGKEYAVESSYGHVRDLPKSKLGVDVKHDFAPTYVIPIKAKPVVAELKKKAGSAERVILATDEDREGEAIAWHLTEALGLGNPKSETRNSKQIPNSKFQIPGIQRIVFHEITQSAIEEALQNPRDIDMDLVDAQQARRILDRLVGYELSPFLWRKVRYGLSAGRVQSVAVRLVVEREREIQAFRSESYWTVEGEFQENEEARIKNKGVKSFRARLVAFDGKTLGKMDIKTKKEVERIVERVQREKYSVTAINKKEMARTPAPPFTTSTLQQEAARKLGFSAKQAMVVAQRLYELGHITYMRTDSVNLATSATAQAKKVIENIFGEKYSLRAPRAYTAKSKGAQEAHEAIRPTNLAARAEELEIKDRGQKRLYDLVWKRTIASQMREAEIEQTSVDIKSGDEKQVFRANGQVVKFDGFIRVYTEGSDDPPAGGEEAEGELPPIVEGEKLALKTVEPTERSTQPPPRYTDATLVKTLEAYGIGRPSTYAPTLSTIQERGYVQKVEKKYQPTEIGFIVNDMLVEHFPEIVDVNFTAHIEEEFDEVAEGKAKWTSVAREFYGPFKKHLDAKEEEVQKHTEVSDTPCPHCGKPMVVKWGRMGKFLACPDPEVKVTLPAPEEAAKIKELEEKTRGERCPICGKEMKVRRSRFGYFLGCVDYPKCKGMKKILNKTGFKCPECELRIKNKELSGEPGDVVEKKSRGRGKVFWACSRYPECEFVINKKPESETELNELFDLWKVKNGSEQGTTKKPKKKTE